MALTNFRPNQRGFEEMAVGPEIRAALHDIAAKAKGTAEAMAQDFRITGDYAGSFEVTEETVELAGHARAAALLVNNSDHAAAVEWGNEHSHRPHRVLGRTLDSLNSGA